MSHHDEPVPEGKDPVLWEIAQNRASFKSHAVTYVIVNAFLWGIWAFADNKNDGEANGYPWPVWTTLCWGIGLAFHFASAYIFHKENSTEEEYDKLKNKQNTQQS